jgi:hypothetical protein
VLRKQVVSAIGAVIIHWRRLKIEPLVYSLRNYFNRTIRHKGNINECIRKFLLNSALNWL